MKLGEVYQTDRGTLRFIPPRRTTGGTVPVKRNWGDVPSRSSPGWVRDMVLYEVFLRNFPPLGDFTSLFADLPRLKDLGITAIWLMPIHPVGRKGRKGRSGSPYAVRDHLDIHRSYGSKRQLKRLVNEAHRMDLRVILDLVLNHSANDHVLMKTKPDYWKKDSKGDFTRRVKLWNDVSEFNFSKREVWQYFLKVMLYWVEEYDIDGYRCDVAGFVPGEFWEFAIPRVRKVKPDFFFLAEWEDPELHLDLFDATYNWTFYYKMCDVAAGHCLPAEMAEAWFYKYYTFPGDAIRLHFLENHDEKRAAAVFGAQKVQPYASFVFLLPGIPLLYNGQEWGAKEYLSLFDKKILHIPDSGSKTQSYYKRLIDFRKKHPAFQRGRPAWLPTTNSLVVAFETVWQNEQWLSLINFSDTPEETQLGRLMEINSIQLVWTHPPSDLAFPTLNENKVRLAPLQTAVFRLPK